MSRLAFFEDTEIRRAAEAPHISQYFETDKPLVYQVKTQCETIILEEVLIILLADRQGGDKKEAASGDTTAARLALMSETSFCSQNLLIVP